jgi:hypothetical protein
VDLLAAHHRENNRSRSFRNQALSDRQTAVLAILKALYERYSVPPSVQQIADVLRLDKSTVYIHMQGLAGRVP